MTITYKYCVLLCHSPLPSFLVHVVFSTKGREPFLNSPELRSSMHAYLTGTSKNLQCEPLQVGGTEDHIHILSGLSRIISIAELVKNLKTSSSRNFRNKGQSTFAWQTGYGAFSVSQSSKANVIAYIANQETSSQGHITGGVPIVSDETWR